jgi:nicotinate-nucleotide pyrophosphorylase (carboxylating)
VLDVSRHLPFLASALEEDAARDDATSRALVPAGASAVADVLAHEPGVLAGLPLVTPLLRLLDPEAVVECPYEDGDEVAEGAVVSTWFGRARAILGVERTALNLLRRLSGIASSTASYVAAVAGTSAKILDTRKTTPGWRELEKYAVRCGGGENHRLRLDDAAMIKENHVLASIGRTGPEALAEAVRRVRAGLPAGVELFVEVETLDELEAVLPLRPRVVMLDGFDLSDLRRAVLRVRASPEPRPLLEATGGVTIENVEAVAAAGVDRISVGAITHSAPALDLSLRVRPR